MPPRIGILMFSNNVKVYMWSRRQGSCSLFILPQKDFGRSLFVGMVIKRPLLVYIYIYIYKYLTQMKEPIPSRIG